MLLREAIGSILRSVREREGKTLRGVAAPGRLSVPYLSEIERGRKEASSEVIAALCGALGIDQSELVRDAAELLAPDARLVDLRARRERPNVEGVPSVSESSPASTIRGAAHLSLAA